MAQSELTPGRSPIPDQLYQEAFIVDKLGNVETPESRTPQIVIHREQLNPQKRAMRIDLDKVAGSSGKSAVYVVLLDFGLPFRTITVNQMFVGADEEGIDVNKLLVTCPSYGWNERTARYIDRRNFDEGGVELGEGQQVVFAHDGQATDYRTGFIQNDAHVVAFTDDWRKPGEKGHFGDYTPIVGVAYEERNLTITTYDDANAEVIFEKMVSQADTAPTTHQPTSEALGEAVYREVIESLQNVLSPDQMKIVTKFVAGVQSFGAENESLRIRVEQGQMHEQALEVALSRNKKLLIDTQGRLQAVLYENEQLKKQAEGSAKANTSSKFRPETRGSGADPLGYCAVLGINSERLFGMHPDEAQKIVGALRNVYSKLYHPDINSEVDPQVMKDINNAADRVITRIKTGYWGRN